MNTMTKRAALAAVMMLTLAAGGQCDVFYFTSEKPSATPADYRMASPQEQALQAQDISNALLSSNPWAGTILAGVTSHLTTAIGQASKQTYAYEKKASRSYGGGDDLFFGEYQGLEEDKDRDIHEAATILEQDRFSIEAVFTPEDAAKLKAYYIAIHRPGDENVAYKFYVKKFVVKEDGTLAEPAATDKTAQWIVANYHPDTKTWDRVRPTPVVVTESLQEDRRVHITTSFPVSDFKNQATASGANRFAAWHLQTGKEKEPAPMNDSNVQPVEVTARAYKVNAVTRDLGISNSVSRRLEQVSPPEMRSLFENKTLRVTISLGAGSTAAERSREYDKARVINLALGPYSIFLRREKADSPWGLYTAALEKPGSIKWTLLETKALLQSYSNRGTLVVSIPTSEVLSVMGSMMRKTAIVVHADKEHPFKDGMAAINTDAVYLNSVTVEGTAEEAKK